VCLSTVPAGVTSLSETTCSSTGGMVAPVPCALTCKNQEFSTRESLEYGMSL
jgi:hypothetical protein